VNHLAWIDIDFHAGLQTPRLKRLAEIVSTQAMAQQERAIDEEPISDGEAV
jgi:hypothetical protein